MNNRKKNWITFKTQIKLNDGLVKDLYGLSKQELKERFGLHYNDINSNIWMFRITESFFLLNKNYLYLYFTNGIVSNAKYTRRKVCISSNNF